MQEVLFWKAGITTNELGEAEINFETGSRKGDFLIIIQGLSENDVVYYTKKIRVE